MNREKSAEEAISAQWGARMNLTSPSPESTSESDTEYELEDIAEEKVRFYFSEDSIEEDDLPDELVNAISNDSLDSALLGDTSEKNPTSPTSNSDVDPGLPRNDYLDFENCLLCKTDEKNISYPYCSSCFTWKKNLFPSRPKPRKKNLNNGATKFRVLSETSLQNNENESNYVEEKTNQGNLKGLLEDSGVGCMVSPSSEDTVHGASQPSISSSSVKSTSTVTNSNISEVCKVCFLKPECGLFVHSNIAHRYGCYTCAREIWYKNGACPLCRRKVSKVIKLY